MVAVVGLRDHLRDARVRGVVEHGPGRLGGPQAAAAHERVAVEHRPQPWVLGEVAEAVGHETLDDVPGGRPAVEEEPPYLRPVPVGP